MGCDGVGPHARYATRKSVKKVDQCVVPTLQWKPIALLHRPGVKCWLPRMLAVVLFRRPGLSSR